MVYSKLLINASKNLCDYDQMLYYYVLGQVCIHVTKNLEALTKYSKYSTCPNRDSNPGL